MVGYISADTKMMGILYRKRSNCSKVCLNKFTNDDGYLDTEKK